MGNKGENSITKKKVWKENSNHSSHVTKLTKILDQALTKTEKILTPFWTQGTKEISEKLWLPEETDSFDLISTSLKNNITEKSWFSIKQKVPSDKNGLSKTSQTLQFSKKKSEVEEIKGESKNKPLRTLKIRIFPDEKEKDKLKIMFEQFLWYYNAMVNVFYSQEIEKQRKYSMYKMRDLLTKHRYVEEREGRYVFCEFVYDENCNKFPIPEWWENEGVHSRLPRGAVCKFVSSLNSAVSNVKNGNIKKFQMDFKTKKDVSNYLHFEDKSYPSFIRKIKSRYWFTTPDRRRINIPYSKIFKKTRKD